MKRVFNIILICIFLLSLNFSVCAETTKTLDPYKGINAQEFSDKFINATNSAFNLYQNRVAGMYANEYLVYKNVDFNKVPEKFEVLAGAPNGTAPRYEIRLDKLDGPLVGSIALNTTGGFTAMTTTEELVLLEGITGVHTLYLLCKSATAHIESIKFFPRPVGIIKSITNESAKVKDILNNPYEKAITVLINLGIIKSNSEFFNPSDKIIRAQFTTYITKLLGYDDAQSGKGTIFKDVKKDYWACGSIEMAYSLGLVSSLREGYFGPDDPISYYQAIKMIIGALGYNEMAKVKGGYPNGYLAVAGELGILKNLKMSTDMDFENIRRDFATQLIYNALDTDILLAKSFGESVKYDKITEDGILGETTNIYKRSGVVTANGITKLTADITDLNINEVEIDGEKYKTGKTSVRDFLGYRISYYYQIDSATDIKTILYAEPYYENQEITINAEEIDGFFGYKLQYTKKEKNQKNISISPKTNVIYNGKAYALESSDYNELLNLHNQKILKRDATETQLPFSGSIKWVDSNKDGVGDVLFVNAAVVYSMNGYSTNEAMLFDRYQKPAVCFDINTEDSDIVIQKDGQDVSFYALQKDSIVTIYQSINNTKRLYRIQLSDKTATGVLNEICDDKFVVDNKEYLVSPDYIEAAGSVYGIQAISLGMSGEFLLDALGRIAGFKPIKVPLDMDVNVIKTGILIAYGEVGNFEKNVKFKIFTQDSKTIICENASKILLDGEEIKDNISLKTYLDFLMGLKGSIIRFKLNTKGELNFMDTYNHRSRTEEDNLNLLTLLTSLGERKVEYQYFRKVGRNFDLDFGIRKDPLVFYAPYPDSSDSENENNYKIIKIDTLVNDTRYYFQSYSYNQLLTQAEIDGLANPADVVVVYHNQLNANNNYMIVEKTANVIDEEGSSTKSVYGYFDGIYKKLVFSSDKLGLADGMQSGDVIVPILDINNKIYDVKYVYNVKKPNDTPASATFGNYFYYGDAVDILDDMLKMKLANNTNRLFVYSGATIFVYDSANCKVLSGTQADLLNNQYKIIACINQATGIMIYIIK